MQDFKLVHMQSPISWPTADADDQKRLEIISNLLWPHEKLLFFLFKTDKPELKGSPEEMKKRAQWFSTGEKVLISLALDVWSNTGGTMVTDLYNLDPVNLQRAFTALFSDFNRTY